MKKTEQELFWEGQFGNDYLKRANTNDLLLSNISLFSQIFKKTISVNSVLEFGSNIGLNLKAINILKPNIELSAVEINQNAVNKLKSEIKVINVYNTSIFDFTIKKKIDFVFTKAVLIHLNPDKLDQAYDIIYNSSKKYICIAEYYNPTPVEVDYRNNKKRLFKRDFAGDMINRFPDLQLVDYGFVYHKDNNFKQDDITWFLLKKS